MLAGGRAFLALAAWARVDRRLRKRDGGEGEECGGGEDVHGGLGRGERRGWREVGGTDGRARGVCRLVGGTEGLRLLSRSISVEHCRMLLKDEK